MQLQRLATLIRIRRALVSANFSESEMRAVASNLGASADQPIPSEAANLLNGIRLLSWDKEAARACLASLVAQHTGPLKVIVFVHGIFSTSTTAFKEMYEDFQRLPGYYCALFDYDFNRKMTLNGDDLAALLKYLNEDCAVTLICHSMGGLIGRLAILTGKAACVRRLFMLGTPNFGALRTAQLGILAQLAQSVSGLIYGIFRRPGVRDLTRVHDIFRDPIADGEQYADEVEYITIPGLFFHEARRVWEIGQWGEWQLWTSGFAAMNVGTEFLTAVLPLWKVSLEKPHDGIVEERSNSFLPPGPGHYSEKNGSLSNPAKFGRTYLHVEHRAAQSLTHVLIQHDSRIIDLVRSILLAPTLSDWYANLDKSASRPLTISFP
jgi:pimeloyl-ACP methyl ester carboxylesterase